MVFLAVLGTVGSVISVLVPWSYYGGIEIPLTRFPFWPVYVACALVLSAAVFWTLFAPAERRRVPRAVGMVAGCAAIGSAIVLGLNYDNSSALFSGVVPLAMPRPGLAPLIAVLAAGLSLFVVTRTKSLTAQPA